MSKQGTHRLFSLPLTLGYDRGLSEVLREPIGGIHIVHSIPGRIRFRVPVLKTRPYLARGLEALLTARPGIIEASVTERCHSLTVLFEPGKWTGESLCQVLNDQTCEVLEVQAASAPATEVSDSLPMNRLQPSRFPQGIEGKPQTREPVKSVYRTLGYYSMVIGAVLVPVPLLPGIPFLLFSSYCFAKAGIWKEKQEAEAGEPFDKASK